MLVRICSDSEQQHEREQRDERIWVPHPTSERVNLKRVAWRELLDVSTLSRRISQYHSQSFPRLERNTPAREGPEKRQSRSSAGFVISGGAFSDLRKGHQFPKIRKSTKWPTGGGAFSDQGERKLPVAPFRTLLQTSDGSISTASALARQLPALASLTCRIGPTW